MNNNKNGLTGKTDINDILVTNIFSDKNNTNIEFINYNDITKQIINVDIINSKSLFCKTNILYTKVGTTGTTGKTGTTGTTGTTATNGYILLEDEQQITNDNNMNNLLCYGNYGKNTFVCYEEIDSWKNTKDGIVMGSGGFQCNGGHALLLTASPYSDTKGYIKTVYNEGALCGGGGGGGINQDGTKCYGGPGGGGSAIPKVNSSETNAGNGGSLVFDGRGGSVTMVGQGGGGAQGFSGGDGLGEYNEHGGNGGIGFGCFGGGGGSSYNGANGDDATAAGGGNGGQEELALYYNIGGNGGGGYGGGLGYNLVDGITEAAGSGGGGGGDGLYKGGYGIYNDGKIDTLYNSQGGTINNNNDGTCYLYGPLFYAGNAPTNYIIYIKSVNEYGQLWCTGVSSTIKGDTGFKTASVKFYDNFYPTGNFTCYSVLKTTDDQLFKDIIDIDISSDVGFIMKLTESSASSWGQYIYDLIITTNYF